MARAVNIEDEVSGFVPSMLKMKVMPLAHPTLALTHPVTKCSTKPCLQVICRKHSSRKDAKCHQALLSHPNWELADVKGHKFKVLLLKIH